MDENHQRLLSECHTAGQIEPLYRPKPSRGQRAQRSQVHNILHRIEEAPFPAGESGVRGAETPPRRSAEPAPRPLCEGALSTSATVPIGMIRLSGARQHGASTSPEVGTRISGLRTPLPLPKRPRGTIVRNIKASLSRASLMRSFSGTSTSSAKERSPGFRSEIDAGMGIRDEEVEEDGGAHDMRYVYGAQPSEYWTGRFVSLSDKLFLQQAESLALAPSTPDRLAPPTKGITPDNITNAANLPTSSTMPSLPLPSAPKDPSSKDRVEALLDGEERSRLVFEELEALCRTPEALRSLAEWREGYARKFDKPGLLPGGSGGLLGRLRRGGAQLV
ncbi:uncharacterized protein DNG_10048 [Cephalotrichum gorgonifer]|uniref:Uncharacterized protein n=1 Tax=Cephalotrichum gorgonifer TaxID=2041049 RepID=A0AAE8N868_9PEZI|nr:uncharacterized protein DNG_10048 [Cephalotrichum gorgonifer]